MCSGSRTALSGPDRCRIMDLDLELLHNDGSRSYFFQLQIIGKVVHKEICRRHHMKRRRKKEYFHGLFHCCLTVYWVHRTILGRFATTVWHKCDCFAIHKGGSDPDPEHLLMRPDSGVLNWNTLESEEWESLKPRSWLLPRFLPVNTARMSTILPSLLIFLFSELQVQVIPCWRGGRGEKSQF